MNPLDYLNKNPALLSIIAFPLGLIILIAVAKFFGMGKIFTDTLNAIREHTGAELKIEMRLSEVVSEIKNVVAAQWDNRRYIDEVKDYFADRFDQIDLAIQTVFQALPKRKDD